MNKIITINLGGIAISIEEDAYDLLRSYLLSVKDYFKGTENGAEIVDDIESRIAEMLYEKLQNQSPSINVADVNEVIAVMGQPKDFDDSADEETFSTSRKKRLFRDPDDGMLGGVCAGLSKYLDVEVTVLRILALIMIFAFGGGLFIYFVLWVVIPKARTTAEKLQMTGEVPNIDNISNTIREEANRAYENIKKKARSSEARKFRSDTEDFLVRIFRTLFKFVAVIASIALLIALIALSAHFFLGYDFIRLHGDTNTLDVLRTSMGGSGIFWLVKASLYAVVLVPILYFLIRLGGFLFGLPRPPAAVKRSFWGVWGLVLLTAISGVVYSLSLLREKSSVTDRIELNQLGDTIEVRIDKRLNASENGRLVQFDIEQSSKGTYLEVEKTSRGRNDAEAEDLASSIPDHHTFAGNEIVLQERVTEKTGNTRAARLHYTLYIPEGKTVVLHSNTSRILHHIDNVQNIYDRKMAGLSFTMIGRGLNCNDCTPNKMREANTGYDRVELPSYNRLEVNEAFVVQLIEDGEYALEFPRGSEISDHIHYEIANGELKIELDDEWGFFFDRNEMDEDMPIIIHSSGLSDIEGNGACDITYIPRKKVEDLYVELNGASKFEAEALVLDNLQIETAGASDVRISGVATLLELESAGASKIDALGLQCDYLRLDVSGASACNVHVLKEISGNVSGASSIRYKGDPEISADLNGLISLEEY